MREEIASLVHPVIAYGLRLKERLDRNEMPDLATEQAALMGLLSSELQARRHSDYGGDGPDAVSSSNPSRSPQGERVATQHFLGVRYALVCWLDEMFALNSPYERVWTERMVEVTLYGSRERAWKFWEQARRAEARSGTDALEGYYLCVMLGFRGDLRDKPADLQRWRTAVEARITNAQEQEFPVPPSSEAPINVPPLHGREKLQKLILLACALLGPLIVIATFFLVSRIGS